VNDGHLPGWGQSKLADLILKTLGGDWGKSPEEFLDGRDLVLVHVIRGTEVKFWQVDKGVTAARRALKVSSLTKRRLRAGDIIVEISGGGPSQPVARTILIDEEALERAECPLVCSNFFRLVRLHPELNPTFAEAQLRFLYSKGAFNEFQTQTTNLRNLNFGRFVEDTEVLIAPLNEQHRIVAKLEKLLDKVDSCQKRLSKIPILLKRFRQAVLAAACSGRLTADWREVNFSVETADELITRTAQHRQTRFALLNNKKRSVGNPKLTSIENFKPKLKAERDLGVLPDTWAWVDLHFLMSPGEPFCYGVVQPGIDEPDGIPLVRAGDLNAGQVSTFNLRRIPPSVDAQYPRSRLRGGELLVTVVGAGIGEAAIVQSECAGFNVARAVAKIPIREFSATFVYHWLCTTTAVGWMKGESREVARPTLNLEQLQTISVPLPPLAEQQEIVRRVDELFSLANQIESRYPKAKQYVDSLKQSILAKAFRGELVPQDPNDEPATVLLERIREARSTEPSKRLVKRTSKSEV